MHCPRGDVRGRDAEWALVTLRATSQAALEEACVTKPSDGDYD